MTSRRVGELAVVGRGDALELRGESRERRALELADALPRDSELAPDRLERLHLAVEPEPELDDPALAVGQLLQRATDGGVAVRAGGMLLRVERARVGEQVAQLGAVVLAQ